MQLRHTPIGRSAVEWSVRGLLAVAAALIGYASVTRTLALGVRTGNVERAHALSPRDGRVTASLAQSFAGADATTADRVHADRLARTALLQDPTVVSAVVTLGIDAQSRGNTGAARRLFAYAETLSRRDLTAQLWAVEDAVGRGDVNDALRHYDIALRTSHTAPDLLFPVLASAISDPAIRVALTRTLAARPNWGEAFANHVAVHGPDPRATARLLAGLRHVGFPVSDTANAEIVNLLIAGNFLDDAWTYYALVHRGADRNRSRDPQFAAGGIAPSAFDWNPVNDAGVSTSIQRGDTAGIFEYSAPASIGGALLQQRQALPPGDYQLQGHSIGIDQPAQSRPYWLLSCPDGRELGRVVLPASTQANGHFVGHFSVPAGCPVQNLVLIARPSDMVSGSSGQVDRIQLSPSR